MNKVIHKADTRGAAEHGWLHSRHTFSFAGYRDPERMGFGKLRVINDDVVAPGAGFDTHPHDNMEIVSVPLSGALRHRDSMGNIHVIKHGEVQIMSAGSGITHSEYNDSTTEPVNFLQIWVIPKEMNIEPRYGQELFSASDRRNRFQTVVSPEQSDDAVWINQDAWFSLADFDAGRNETYSMNKAGNGVYFFVIEGQIETAGEKLEQRDGIGITETSAFPLRATGDCQLLAIEVPMN